MVGLATLQLGAHGVAASASTRPAKSRTAPVKAVIENSGPNLENSAGKDRLHQRDDRQDHPENRYAMATVAPATLFAASQIAERLPSPGTADPATAARARAIWTPPASSLSLRDRSI